MAAGRPKEGLNSLPHSWKDDVLKLYEQGASDVEVKGYIYKHRGSFSDDLWYRWMDEEEEFSGTIKRGRIFSQMWWEKNGRENLTKSNFSWTGWFMNMKNRFPKDWMDKQEIKANVETIQQITGFEVK